MRIYDDYRRCDFCDEWRECVQLLFDGRHICEECADAHINPCPTCNDIVIDGEDGEQCAVCVVFFPLEREETNDNR